MQTQRSISEIADEIAAKRLPSLFIDTCAVLDLVRCASRGSPRVAQIVLQVIDRTQAAQLLLYAPSVLQKEAARNLR